MASLNGALQPLGSWRKTALATSCHFPHALHSVRSRLARAGVLVRKGGEGGEESEGSFKTPHSTSPKAYSAILVHALQFKIYVQSTKIPER